MPACRRRKSIRRSTLRGCSTFIATPIRAPEQMQFVRGVPAVGSPSMPRSIAVGDG